MKLPAARVDQLVDVGRAHPFAPAGRRFREWAAISPTRRRSWPALLEEALAFVASQPPPMKKRTVSTFAGFPPDAWAFLTELQAGNSKTFFDANRQRYDDGIDGPSQALVETLAVVLPDRLGLDVRAEPKVGRSLFRINRDTRFAADKTPYKTHLDFLFWVGDGPPRARPAFIMRITANSVLVGGGRMAVTGGSLDAYRAALDDPKRSDAVRTAVDTLLAGGAELSDPDRSKPPRPFPRRPPQRRSPAPRRVPPHPDDATLHAIGVRPVRRVVRGSAGALRADRGLVRRRRRLTSRRPCDVVQS